MNKQSLTKLALGGIMTAGIMLTGCNSTDPAPTPAKPAILSAKTLADFKTACATIKDATIKVHDCKGQNTCKGFNYQEGKEVTSQDCTAKSSCVGTSCIEPM